MVKILGLVFNVVQPSQISGKPEARNIVNNFDLQGNLLSTERLQGESNVDYKARLYDVTVHPGGPLYEGIINDLGRAFGYIRQPAVSIDLKKNSNGDPIAISPSVSILANRMILYSDWRPDGTRIIDKEIRIYQLIDSGYYLDDLVTEINESSCFSAEVLSGIRPNLISNQLVRGTSNAHVRSMHVRSDNMIQMPHKNILKNSVRFMEKDVFNTELETNIPLAKGEYYLDYINGEIYTYSIPSGLSYCSYYYGNFPYVVEYSPVQIFSLNDDDFQYELFNRKILESGEDIPSLPNSEGSEIYNQLFKETKVFWGE